jgi:hemin uptake protein HemP
MNEPCRNQSEVDQANGYTDLDGCEVVVRHGVGRVTSEKLFGGLRELEIAHDGSLYRLRITSTGKLILTK